MKNYLITLFIIFSTLSCESIVDVELPKQSPLIVVNSFFTPDSAFKVHLSKSIGILESYSELNEYGYYENKIPILENAKVELWQGDNYVAHLNYAGKGFYKGQNIYPSINNDYKIIVSSEGFSSISAYDKVPDKIPIDNVLLESNFIDDYSFLNDLTITFSDDPNEKNYYQVSILGKSDFPGSINAQELYFESNDILISDNYIFSDDEKSFYGYAAYFDDAIISGKEYKLKISTYDINYQSEVYVVLSSLSENLYKYLVSVKKQEASYDNPFAEPVSIHSNIQNGLGIFGGYSTSFYKIK